MERTGYIYKVTCSDNGKIYIGQTRRSVEKRWYQHCYSAEHNLEKNSKLHRAISKYGKENFVVEVLWEGTMEEDALVVLLNKLESDFIDLYYTVEYGYNIALGGGGVRKLNKKTENMKEYQKQYEYSPKRKEYRHQYWQDNAKKKSEYNKAWNEAHPDYWSTWYAANKDRLKAKREAKKAAQLAAS